MEGSSYNLLGSKKKNGKPFYSEMAEVCLEQLYKENLTKLQMLQKNDVLKAFCISLKKLLELDDIKVLISSLFDIEFILNSLKAAKPQKTLACTRLLK